MLILGQMLLVCCFTCPLVHSVPERFTHCFTVWLKSITNSVVQEFVVRNDCPCGTTIGPTISNLTGIRVVDAGMPQLSMHSVREVMGIADLQNGIDLFLSFFKNFRKLDDNMSKEIEGTTAYD